MLFQDGSADHRKRAVRSDALKEIRIPQLSLYSSPRLHREVLCSVNQFLKATLIASSGETIYDHLRPPTACLREAVHSLWARNPCERCC